MPKSDNRQKKAKLKAPKKRVPRDRAAVANGDRQFREVSASKGDLLSLGQASPKQAEQARRFPNPLDQVIEAAGIPG